MDMIALPARTLEQVEFIIGLATLMLVGVALYIDHKGLR